MNTDYEKQLEAAINRALKRLPELKAPGTLVARVMERLERRKTAPWYRQDWQAWPLPIRVGGLAALVLLFGALCFAGAEAPHTRGFSLVLAQVHGWLLNATALGNAVQALGETALITFRHLGTPILIGCLTAVGLAWAMCLGLGTYCVRLAMTRR